MREVKTLTSNQAEGEVLGEEQHPLWRRDGKLCHAPCCAVKIEDRSWNASVYVSACVPMYNANNQFLESDPPALSDCPMFFNDTATTEIYTTLEAQLHAVNKHASSQGYTVVKTGQKKNKDGEIIKNLLKCTHGGKYKNQVNCSVFFWLVGGGCLSTAALTSQLL